MVITVRLHSTLRRQTKDGLQDCLELKLEPGATVTSVLEALDIPPDSESIMLVVNGRMARPDQSLTDGDEVRLMPALSGG